MKLATIIATCENLDDIHPPIPESTPVEQQEAETELVDAEAVSDSDYGTVNDIDTGMTDAITSLDTLEEARDVVADGAAEDVTETELATMETLLSGIHHSLAIPRVTPTLESHSIQNREQLVLTMESTMENIKNALINGMKTAWEAVKKFLNNLFQNKEALKKYLQGVAHKLSGMDGQLGQGQHGGFTSYKAAQEGIKTAYAMMELVSATADSFHEAVARNKEDFDGQSSHKVAAAIGTKTNDILNRMTTLKGAGEGGKDLRGFVSGGKGLPVYVEGAQLTFERPAKYSNPPYGHDVMTVQQASDLIRQALGALEKLQGMKKFENALAGIFKVIGGAIGSTYSSYKSSPDKGQTTRTEEQTGHKKDADKKIMVAAFRGVAHVYGALMPREVFGNISNIGKYIDACISATARPASAPADGEAQKA